MFGPPDSWYEDPDFFAEKHPEIEELEQRIDEASDYLKDCFMYLYDTHSFNEDKFERSLEELAVRLGCSIPRSEIQVCHKKQYNQNVA